MAILIFAENIFKDLVTRRGVSDALKNIYTKEDASIEIGIMLLGSFLFGFLLRHFLGFFTKKVIIKSKEKNDLALSQEPILVPDIIEEPKIVAETPAIERSEESHELFLPKSEAIFESPKEEPIVSKTIVEQIKEDVAPIVMSESPISSIFSEPEKTSFQLPIETPNSIISKPVKEVEVIKEIVIEKNETPVFEINKLDTPPIFEPQQVDVVQELLKNEVAEKPLAQTEVKSTEVHDLKSIEGIGPAIEKLLNSKGITNFHQLASHSVASLEEILDEAGPRFRVHVPDLWPTQAKLLLDNDIIGFNELTESIRKNRI